MACTDCRPLPLLTEKDIARFWSKVDKRGPDDCWPWKAGTFKEGYGEFSIKEYRCGAHRIALFLHSGVDHAPLNTCHSCDVRYSEGDTSYKRCCNGSHMFPGTPADNVADMTKKGRNRGLAAILDLNPEQRARGDRNGSRLHPERLRRGEHNATSKLTEEQVREIRRIREQHGTLYKTLAIQFSVSTETIALIVLRKVWKHVPSD